LPNQGRCPECGEPYERATPQPHQTITDCLKCGYDLFGLADRGRCPECGHPFDKYWGIWAHGKTLIFAKGVIFPERCVKCNCSATGKPLKLRFYWHHPAWYALFLLIVFSCFGLLVALILIAIIRKKAVVRVRLCPRHHGHRVAGITAALVGVIACIIGVPLAAASNISLFAPAGLLALTGGLVCLIVFGRVLRPTRIDNDFVWAKGAGDAFLSTLPELPKAELRIRNS